MEIKNLGNEKGVLVIITLAFEIVTYLFLRSQFIGLNVLLLTFSIWFMVGLNYLEKMIIDSNNR
jgi:hypothetical protein